MIDNTDQVNKSHKPRQGGRKANKKKAKNDQEQNAVEKNNNPKAFAVKSYVKALNTHTRTADIKAKKVHIPVVDRTPVLPPPTIVAIVGGAKSGKSTLLQGIVKNFTHRRMSNLMGPITIIAGKKNRFTFIEVNSDVNCMIDVAKVADVALLLVDATVGIEFEIFEFMEICKAHGAPRILGVMNHLDGLKQNKSLKKAKKSLKQRFQNELYPGAKMFFITGISYGSYLRNEMSNLGRFLSVMKFRPLNFRSTHPYVLVDRWEDITNQNDIRINEKCDRELVLYGYVRGASFSPGNSAHIPGCGDFTIQSIDQLDDPCPYPHKLKKRSLNSKERLVYAPMAGVSGIIFDKDAVYIDLGGSHYEGRKGKGKRTIQEVKEDDEEAALLEPLLKLRKTAEEKVEDTAFTLFPDSAPLKRDALVESDDDDEVVNAPEKKNKKLKVVCKMVTDANGNSRKVAVFEDDENGDASEEDSDTDNSSCDDDEDDSGVEESGEDTENDMDENEFRARMFLDASLNFNSNQNSISRLTRILYDDGFQENDKSGDDRDGTQVGNLFKRSDAKEISFGNNIMFDNEQFIVHPVRLIDWSSEELRHTVKDVFATGEWGENESAEKLLKMNEEAEMFGDFEDLETGDQFKAEEPVDAPEVEKKDKKKKSEKTAEERRMEKKKRLKEMFDANYDDGEKGDHFEDLKEEMSQQGQLNKSEFENMSKEDRTKVEGFRSGLYVRIEFHKMPCEFVSNFDPTYPIIVGGLMDNEENYRIVRTRLKVHRYYHKILKNRDPLIFSLGWRRLQSMVYFAKREDDFRLRSLKYAKKYLHVEAFLWGPAVLSNTGFVAYQNMSEGQFKAGFRIAANGVVLEVNESDKITKKLKLIGHPKEIMGKSAYIKDMFHSDIEVSRFLGCKLQTQSTIRGILKKPSHKHGDFRAKFEDRIQMSDIIILKTWVKIEMQKFCTCVRTLLLPINDKANWQGMRTVAEIKRAQNMKNTVNPDHLYTPITERRTHISLPLVIPKPLQAALPYKYKEKIVPTVKEPERVIVVKDPEEVKVDEFLRKLKVVMTDKIIKATDKKKLKRKIHKKKLAQKDALHALHERKTKKEECRLISKRIKK